MEQKFLETEKKRGILIITIILVCLLMISLLLFFLFHKKQYEITFDSNGGSQIASVKVKENDKIEQPDDPIREGYIFGGWYYLNELYDFTIPVKSNMTLKAEWAVLGNAEVKGISLNATELTLTPGESATLIATLLAENTESVKLVWSSSDESIATVDENGNIKALKEGVTTITVATEDENYSASCTVTIAQKEDSNINNNDNNSSNNNNNNNNNSKPSNPSTPNTPSAPTTPSNPSTPTTPDNPTTPSQPEEQTKPTTVDPTDIIISGSTTVEVGNTIQLSATVKPDNATNKTVSWSSSDSSIATVDGNGNVKGISEGEVTITAKTSNGKSAEHKVKVSSVYKIYLKARKMEVTDAITQYDFRVTKDGKDFTGYISFTYNGSPIFKEDGSVSSTVVNKNITTAVINFSDRTTRKATVVIN